MRTLITREAGFINSNLSETPLFSGYDVDIIDNLSTVQPENVEYLSKQVVLDQLVSQCEVISHMVTAVEVKLIIDNPVHTMEPQLSMDPPFVTEFYKTDSQQ